ncbi:MAG: hypothetical protein CVV27_17330 [Candidatus Melainabacteria bacterium HGW-Melainabacteria-1]|nr:MAG: hypothetical protein CVV27_17330 [Candidatus Melainabacteria bacterium HGW-Melainabacteria-1]
MVHDAIQTARRALQRQDPGGALQALAAGLARAPEAPELLLEYGMLLIQLDRSAEAMPLLARIQPDSGAWAESRYQLACLQLQHEQTDAAITSFESLLPSQPNTYAVWLGLAQAYLHAEQPAASRRCFARAEAIQIASPDWPVQCWQRKLQQPARLFKKLRHDRDYLNWLAKGRSGAGTGLPEPSVILSAGADLDRLEAQARQEFATGGLSLDTSCALDAMLERLAWVPEPAPVSAPLLRSIPSTELEKAFGASFPQYLVIDDFLSPAALASLLGFCRDANVWRNYWHGENYLCAYPQDGINIELIYVLAAELRAALPGVFGPHKLKKFWLYKYSSQQHQGVQIHADTGAVNVNLWLAPEQANLDPGSGGLLLYDVEAPPFATDQAFHAFNRDPLAIQGLLRSRGAREYRVPYRQNRVTIFNANLLHQTMPYHFDADYPHQRLNLTLMFGQRGRA